MSREQRNYLFQYLEIYEQSSGNHLGYLMDISEHGLMFISEKAVPIGQVFNAYLETHPDEHNEFGKESIKFQIQSIWSKPNINPVLSCIGCKITQIDPKDEISLIALAKTLRFDSDIQIHRVSSEN